LIDHFVFVIVFLAGDFALVDFALFGVARLAVVFAFALALGDGRSTGWKQPPMGWVLTVRMKIFPFFLALGLSIIKNSRDNFLVINKGSLLPRWTSMMISAKAARLNLLNLLLLFVKPATSSLSGHPQL
jgi:hypothetical protein